MGQRLVPWFMWFFPLTFFGFQFILRLFPGLIMPEFLMKYHITATDFGVFASLYYLGYAGMQIPMAILLDKFGPRKIIAASAVLCGVATCLYILFSAWHIALLSRFLIGVGSVVGFLGTSKIISTWFPQKDYTKLVGLTFSFGLLGALYGGRPVSLMINHMGWEKVSLVLGAAAIILGLFVFTFVRDNPKTPLNPTAQPDAPLNIGASLKKLFTHKPLLTLAFASFFMVGSLEGFADIWGVPYLMASRNLSTFEAAGITSYIYIGMLFGGPLLAFFASKYKAHNVTMVCGILMAILLSTLLFFNAQLPQWCLEAMMFCIGLLCCYQVIIFSIGSAMVPAYLLSMTIAVLNCINMLGGTFFHSMIGILMDYFENTFGMQDASNYSLEAYTFTLLLIPMTSLLGACLALWSKKATQEEKSAMVLS